MKRRKFLGLFGGAAALASANLHAAAPTSADEFVHRGYRVKWMGWREPMNQTIVFGLWFAAHVNEPNHDHQVYAATTLGVAGRYHEMACIDTTRLPDWPVITAFSPDEVREDVKERARLALLHAIDEGTADAAL
jgi:hypothetical protein